MIDGPIACTLSPGRLRERQDALGQVLTSRASETTRLSDGIRVSFPADAGIVRLLADIVEAERQCCPFLRFVLSVQPAGGGIALELTGPPGTREFLEEFLAPFGQPGHHGEASR